MKMLLIYKGKTKERLSKIILFAFVFSYLDDMKLSLEQINSLIETNYKIMLFSF